MDKTEACSRLVFCGECCYWHPLHSNIIKKEYRGYVGYCNKPHETMVERYKDDFCSRGYKHVILDTKRED